jgi:hypothetical protein
MVYDKTLIKEEDDLKLKQSHLKGDWFGDCADEMLIFFADPTEEEREMMNW